MGGCVAMRAALTFPRRIRSLVLADTTSRYAPETARLWADRVRAAARPDRHRPEPRLVEVPPLPGILRMGPDEDRGAIVAVLPRRSRFSRRMAGQVTDEQVVAANVNITFIVMGLDHDYSARRLERYLLLAR